MATDGLLAPDGFLWCRRHSGGPWHLLRAGELTHEGKPVATVRSVCALWASVLPGHEGWAEVVPRATPGPRRVCPSCMAGVAETRRRDRLVTLPTEQGRLF